MAMSRVRDRLDDDEEAWEEWEDEDEIRLRILPDAMPSPPGYCRWFDGTLYREGWRARDIAPLPDCSERCYVFRYLSPSGPDDLLMAFRVHDLLGHQAVTREALRQQQAAQAPPPPPPPLTTPHLSIDVGQGVVRCDGAPIALTRLEWRVLALLVRGYGRLVPHEVFLQEIWDSDEAATHTHAAKIRTQVGRLRLKLDPSAPARFIQNTIGVGYLLWDPDDEVDDG